jgi:hypothetical protein
LEPLVLDDTKLNCQLTEGSSAGVVGEGSRGIWAKRYRAFASTFLESTT